MPGSKAIPAVWHKHYDDALGDITLVSKDHVKFSTTSGVLGRASTVFQPMKSMPAPDTGQSTESSIIDIDHSAAVIETFLDLASVSKPILPNMTLRQCDRLLEFIEQFDCKVFFSMVRLRLCQLVITPNRKAQMLIAASDRDDWEMGRTALAGIDVGVVKWIRGSPMGLQGYLDHLEPKWRRTVMDLLFFRIMKGGTIIHDWSKLSEDLRDPGPSGTKRKYAHAFDDDDPVSSDSDSEDDSEDDSD